LSDGGAAATGQPGGRRRALVLSLVAVAFLVLMVMELAGVEAGEPGPPPPAGKILEELRYRVDVMLWRGAVKSKVVFQELAPGRYRAEVSGETQGFLALISGNWRGSFSTEMQYSQGNLLPLVYREASQSRSRKSLKEYRFDYTQKKVELWALRKNGAMVKRWETTFEEPMYDSLTFFYNRRLKGAPLGQGGESVKFNGIPYPKPEEILLRVGDRGPEGRKIMVEIENRVFENERSQIYALIDNEGVPTRIWTRVLMFGKIDVELLPGGKRVKPDQIVGMGKQARVEHPDVP